MIPEDVACAVHEAFGYEERACVGIDALLWCVDDGDVHPMVVLAAGRVGPVSADALAAKLSWIKAVALMLGRPEAP